MALAGFDGRIRQTYPAMGKWLAASFAVAVVYWVVCWYWLSFDLMVQVMLTPINGLSPLPLLIANVPFLLALGLAFPFGLAERSVRAWLILIVAARLTTGFGYFTTVFGLGLLHR